MPDRAAPISVLMATRGESPYLAAALASLDAQSLRPAEVLVVYTGTGKPPPELNATTRTLPIRTLSAPGRNLAAALNIGLREAKHPLIARMDDDDESLPARFAQQAAHLSDHPDIAVLGTSFERIDPSGRPLGLCVQPADPREVRWRLLIQNCVAHGSVMLRRGAVLEAGGYDESCDRAQDYDLWLRLSAQAPCIANLPEVLYRYRCDPTSKARGQWVPSSQQSSVAARALIRAWDALPSISPDAELESLLATVMSSDPAAAPRIESLLTRQGPTRQRLQALTWARTILGATPWHAVESGRAALLREASARLHAVGARAVKLWGAGQHAAWVLDHAADLAVPVSGLVDDHLAGTQLLGHAIEHPRSLRPGEHVLISSDAHEHAIWNASADARARGVHVWRLYDNAPNRDPVFAGAPEGGA